jgi:hypothetical protein
MASKIMTNPVYRKHRNRSHTHTHTHTHSGRKIIRIIIITNCYNFFKEKLFERPMIGMNFVVL